MPIATELNVDTSATAMDMANAMFGNGISITSASFTGAGAASGTYTGGLSTLGSLTQSDTGVILSTGNVTDFTNSSGTADTNTNAGTTTNHTGVGEVDGDTELNAVSGQATQDGAFFDATFVATGDLLTMQFVFTSEEYLEYVNGGVNDAMGVWVNGTYIPLTLADGSTQNVTIDTINNTVNSNLYLDNPAATDIYNTEMDGGTVVNFDEIENVIICFTEGTRIATPRGTREIEDLEIGDLVVTRDHGLQPIRWVGKRTVPARGALAPIRFDPHVIGNERALYVSPQHRMLMQGVEASLLFGESEVLASAKHLVNGSTVTEVHGGTVTYVHIMFDQHEIIYAEGAASESFYPGGTGLNAVEEEAREELFSLFPELRSHEGAYGDTARLCLKAHESRLLRLG